jgi:hypothetical protein
MARKAWVLETATKGTGANMVPLERVLKQPSSDPAPLYVPPKRQPPAAPAPETAQPRRFKVLDVLTRQLLGEDVSARETVDLLRGVRSVLDVHVYVWEPKRERWRMLTLDEQGTMWELRDQLRDR